MTDTEKLNLILEKVTTLDDKVTTLDEKVTMLDEKATMLDEKVADLETDLKEVKQQVIKTNLIIENELRVNIQRVAEGHLDLSRNLHEAMKPSNELEMLSIKVHVLESDMRDVKAKLA